NTQTQKTPAKTDLHQITFIRESAFCPEQSRKIRSPSYAHGKELATEPVIRFVQQQVHSLKA
ncbi:MAG: hypothetical protein Q8J61_02445, partial [Sulfuricella sp.]|nr:hypothetical protein [Sulfuricella sp.]